MAADTVTTGTDGSSQNVSDGTSAKEVGGKKSSKSAKKYGEFFLSYPLDRLNTGEDSLLIQSVRYKPPKNKMGSNIAKNMNTAYFEPNEEGGVLVNDIKGVIKYNDAGNVRTNDQINPGIKNVLNDPNFKGLNFGLQNGNNGMDKTYNIKKSSKNNKSGLQFATDTNFYVELPVPKQVQDGNSVDWEGSSMNLFTLAGMDIASLAMTEPGKLLENSKLLIDELVQTGNIGDALGIESGDTLIDSIRASLAGAAVNQFGANVTTNNVLSRSTGQILNSNTELLFNGVNLRVFKFGFTFTPRSKRESDRALQIIRQMKMSMSPKKGDERAGTQGGGVMLGAPDIFLLRYLHNGKDHPFLNSFKPCALTDFNVNYTGSNTYSTYADGTPVHMKVSMTFKETNPVYLEDYEDAQLGVGY